MSKLRILVIEDDRPMAELILRNLVELEAEIIHATTIAEGMAELDRMDVDPADIITLDINLPDSKGQRTLKEALPAIREKNPNAVILILTGVLGQQDRETAISLGADDLLEKCPEHFAPTGTLARKLRDIAMSLIRQPVRYKRNSEILSKLSERIASKLESKNQVAKDAKG